jgi:2-polyprenyl-3-methyl-5-hydroxy-6-metoxy-1,4-benzoquinol methylase
MLICAACGHSRLKTFARRDAKSRKSLMLGFCSDCGLMQQTEIPRNFDLAEYYSHNYRKDYKKTLVPQLRHVWRAGNAAINRIEFLRKALPGTFDGTILVDVGAGGGEFVYLARKFGFKSRGIEPNVGYSEFARDNYCVEVLTAGIESLERNTADVITLFHVLEHLPSPAMAAKILYSALKDEGVLFVEVPNILQVDASPANIFFRAHLFYFSKSTLCSVMNKYFEPIYSTDKGNLKIVFRKRKVLISENSSIFGYAQDEWLTFAQKGWLQYLTLGNGWKKPFIKLKNNFVELSLFALKPKEILDSIFSIYLQPKKHNLSRLQKRLKLLNAVSIIASLSIFVQLIWFLSYDF